MFWDTVKTMENKNTPSQLPTALWLDKTIPTVKNPIVKISISILLWLAMCSIWLPIQPYTLPVYVNDVALSTGISQIHLYADETTIYIWSCIGHCAPKEPSNMHSGDLSCF